jgi:LysR family transcriptional regulator, benzoate and cis,cis-muconate-responsive activator of ben and cat genes
MQLHRLEGFYWVARTGGYARAARAFPYPLTQPAVYQQVHKLEDELGMRLFERSGGQVHLTAAGRHLYRFAAPFFEQLPAVVRALRAGAHGSELRIGAEALVLHRLLPEWLRRLHRRLPEVRVDLRELAHGDPEPVQSGAIDLAVAYFPTALPPGVQARTVANLRPTLVMPDRHPLARLRRPDLRRFSDETFIAYHEGTLQHDLQMKALASSGLTPRRLVSASTAEAILGLVAAGIGYSLVPALADGDPRRRGVTARPFSAAGMVFPIQAVWRRTSPPHPAVEAALATAPAARP